MEVRNPLLLATLVLLQALVPLQAATTSPQQAVAFATKVEQIRLLAETPKTGLIRTALTEDELNSWLAYDPQARLPDGVSEPQLTLLGQGRVNGRAVVDLERVAAGRSSGGALDPWAYLSGRVPIVITGTLQTASGRAQFSLERAEVSGIPVPSSMVEQIVRSYLSTPDDSDEFSLTEGFELPANIRHIEVAQGRAVVVQ